MENDIKKIESELAVFNPIVAGLSELKEQAQKLSVKGVDDKEGYKAVKSFRTQKVVKLRKAIEDKRKEIKSFYLEAGKAIDSRAKEIFNQIELVENYLESQEKIVDDEQERIKAEKAKIIAERVDKRTQALRQIEFNDVIFPKFLEEASDEEFLEFIKPKYEAYKLKKQKEAEEKAEMERLREVERVAKEKEQAERLRAENERRELEAKQRAEIEAKNKELEAQRKAQQAEIDRKNKELEAIKAKEKAEQELKAKEELKAKKKIEDENMFLEIKTMFPTLELAWVEIARLRKIGGIK